MILLLAIACCLLVLTVAFTADGWMRCREMLAIVVRENTWWRAEHGKILDQAAALQGEVVVLRSELERSRDARCPVMIQGERCCLAAGHGDSHRWARGD